MQKDVQSVEWSVMERNHVLHIDMVEVVQGLSVSENDEN